MSKGRAIEIIARHPEMARPGAIPLLVVGILVWLLVVGGAVFPPAAIAGPIPAVIAGLFWLLPVLAGPILGGTVAKVKIGADGITIRSLGRTRFIAFRDVIDCAIARARITLRLRNGKLFQLQIVKRHGKGWMPEVHTDHPAAQLIRAGMETSRRAREPSREEAALLRRARPDKPWLDVIELEARETAQYRGAPIDREALAKLCADPSADPTVRAAAALVLRTSGLRAFEREVLAEAASATAHPQARIALEAAADDEVDEHEVKRAVLRVR